MGEEDRSQQDYQHQSADDDIHSIALQREGADKKRNPGNGSGDQQQDSKLDDRQRAAVERVRDQLIYGSQRLRYGMKHMVIGYRGGVVDQVKTQSDESDEAGQQDAGSEDLTDQNFNLLVVQ